MAKSPARAFRKLLVRSLPGVKTAAFPGFIEPCQPTLRPKLPEGARWQYEIKFDGYRVQLHLKAGAAKAFTRNGLDWTRQFAELCAAAASLPATAAVIDGEVIVQDKNGVPDFGALRAAITSAPHRLQFYAFDLLHLDGFDLRGAVLTDRRRVLAQLLAARRQDRIVLSEAIEGAGAELLQHACDLGLEGIVAKRADAPYRSGRSENWIKVKCVKSLRFPVVGFVPAKGNSIAAIRLARREGGKLLYAGKAGTGFTERTAQSVRARLEPLMRKTPPLAKPLRKKDTVWVEPQIEATIEFRGITEDGMLRHASFKGLA